MRTFFASFSAADPLPSWNDTGTKKAIIDFVGNVTKEGSPDFVRVPRRIAVIDNDGTLWCDNPLPSQALFTVDGFYRNRDLRRTDPET